MSKPDETTKTEWNRECVVCGHKWFGGEHDDCPREDRHAAPENELAGDLSYMLSLSIAENAALKSEVERLQRIIDSRPAINAGLPETYIEWSRSIYELEIARTRGLQQ